MKISIAILESIVWLFTAMDFNGDASDVSRPRRIRRVF